MNWTEQYDMDGSGSGISFVNTTTGYFCDNYGRIYKTTNSGVNWTEQYDMDGSGSGISFP